MDKIMVVNGVDFMPYLQDFSVTIEDLDSDSTVRNAEGTLSRDRVAVKQKIALIFKALSEEELSIVLSAVAPVSIDVKYTNPSTNSTRTGEFYVGPRNTGNISPTLLGVRHVGVTFNLVEL